MTTARHAFNEGDRYCMRVLAEAGYGWSKYACSVERQGYITEGQRVTLRKMMAKLDTQREHIKNQKVSSDETSDISDLEAMSMQEFF